MLLQLDDKANQTILISALAKQVTMPDLVKHPMTNSSYIYF